MKTRTLLTGKTTAKAGGAALLGCLLAGALIPTTASATCASNTLTAGTETTISISFGGANRSYILHVPASYTGLKGVPLVIDMHGFTSSASGQRGVSKYNAESDAKGFIVAWPTGRSNSWNAYGCCGTSLRNNVNDVGFIRAVVADIVRRGVIDESRIYATGLSNGGSMSHRLACEASDLFAVTSPVSFPLNRTACPAGFPTRKITVAHYHGLNDNTVPYNGGGSNNFQSAPNSFAAWRTTDACSATIARQNLSSTESVQTATGCSDGTTPALISLAGTHVLYNTQTTLNIADHAWTNFLSPVSLAGKTTGQYALRSFLTNTAAPAAVFVFSGSFYFLTFRIVGVHGSCFSLRAVFRQQSLDLLLKILERLRAADQYPVNAAVLAALTEKKGRGAAYARFLAVVLVFLYAPFVFFFVETVVERFGFETELRRVGLEIFRLQLLLIFKKHVVRFPVFVLIGRAVRRFRRLARLRMNRVQRKIAEHVTHLAGVDVLRLEAGERLLVKAATERTLIVGELDQRQRRVVPSHRRTAAGRHRRAPGRRGWSAAGEAL